MQATFITGNIRRSLPAMSLTLLPRGKGTQIRDDGLEEHCKNLQVYGGWIMKLRMSKHHIGVFTLCILCGLLVVPCGASAADKLFTIYTARVMSQAYPWIAAEAGLFKKYDLEIPLIFVTPGAPAVAAILSGDSEVAVIGAASIPRPIEQGNKYPIITGGVKRPMTDTNLAQPEVRPPN